VKANNSGRVQKRPLTDHTLAFMTLTPVSRDANADSCSLLMSPYGPESVRAAPELTCRTVSTESRRETSRAPWRKRRFNFRYSVVESSLRCSRGSVAMCTTTVASIPESMYSSQVSTSRGVPSRRQRRAELPTKTRDAGSAPARLTSSCASALPSHPEPPSTAIRVAVGSLHAVSGHRHSGHATCFQACQCGARLHV